MISKYDVIKVFEQVKKEGKDSFLYLNKETEKIYEKDTNEFVCSLDTYVTHLKKKHHCNFEVIYDEHVSLTTIYRCLDCGTVIFGGDDERWDPNLKCPVCSEYSTWLKYWSGEDIKNDPQKQKEISGIIKAQEYQIEHDLRVQKRGLYDFQLYKKSNYGKKYGYRVEFNIDNITNKFKFRGLSLSLNILKRDDNDVSLSSIKRIYIPLSFSAFYIHKIYPYSNKCPTDLRKYHFWQRNLSKYKGE